VPDFASAPLWMNFSVFAIAAVIVWIAGTLIARYADTISKITGIGHAALGVLLLAGITSLPEVAVSVTSAVGGNVELAVNNLFGGIAMQVAVLAVADITIRRAALTAVVPNPIVLLQGALNILLLSIAVCGIVAGDKAVFGVGLWVWLILAVYLYGVRLLARSDSAIPWRAIEGRDDKSREDRSSDDQQESQQLSAIIFKTVAGGLAIVVAGYVLSKSGEAIAEQTGLGSSFVGAVFVAISTSLPEVSTVLSAVRLGNYTMAISDILGTNLLTVALLFLVDAADGTDAALNKVGRFSIFAAVLGTAVTALFTIGLLERRDRTVLGMGYDSAAVLVSYFGGLVILFFLRTP
jgi:cation:H+ antiporter